MQLLHRNGNFIFQGTFDEKDVPKTAGLRWNSIVQKFWATSDPRIAARLIDVVDMAPEVRAAIDFRLDAVDLGPRLVLAAGGGGLHGTGIAEQDMGCLDAVGHGSLLAGRGRLLLAEGARQRNGAFARVLPGETSQA